MKRIVLLSDTHGTCDERMCKYLTTCDEIWHAGDIGSLAVYDKLRKFAPLRAVYGNADDYNIRHECPEFLRFEIEGIKVLMTHIGGYPGKYNIKAYREICKEKPTIFVCGHSHILRVIYDKNIQMMTMNPGAIGLQGFHQVRTMLRFEIDKGDIKNLEVVEIPRTFDNQEIK